MQRIVILLFAIMSSGNAYPLPDLEDQAQEFVLETKQIIVPDYPDAFNPAIIEWHNKILMSFRLIPDPKHSFTSLLGLVWLNNNFEPISKPQLFTFRSPDSTVPARSEDARLITIDNKLYMIYTDNEDIHISKGGYRIYIAQIEYDGKQFNIHHTQKLSSFEGNDPARREKNWVPFVYNNKLLLAYSLNPHKIFYPLMGTGSCHTIASTEHTISWPWGELRGGTQALLDGDHYLAFFHSAQRMVTANSFGKEAMHYFMGAYTFCPHPPFAINHVSKEPIIGKKFYNGAEYKPYWGSVRVVFPCGFIMDTRHIWIAYGRQDRELWVAKLDKKRLYASLVSV